MNINSFEVETAEVIERESKETLPNSPTVPYSQRRRCSLPVKVTEEEEQSCNKKKIWRRSSLDFGLELPLKQGKFPKEEVKEEEKIEKNCSLNRKRSICEDIGDEFILSDYEEEKPKKTRVKRTYRGRRNRGKSFECAGTEKCSLCKSGAPYYLQKSMNPGWRETLLAVFENFTVRVTLRDWIIERKIGGDIDSSIIDQEGDVKWLYLPDAYSFLEYHWDILCPPQHKNRPFNGSTWRKTLQDTLSHNRSYFISGKELFGKTGYWRLNENIPIQAGRSLPDFRIKHSTKSPSMFTIDSILKRAEAQGQIPTFEGTLNSSKEINAIVNSNVQKQSTIPREFSELEVLIEAIEKMQSSKK